MSYGGIFRIWLMSASRVERIFILRRRRIEKDKWMSLSRAFRAKVEKKKVLDYGTGTLPEWRSDIEVNIHWCNSNKGVQALGINHDRLGITVHGTLGLLKWTGLILSWKRVLEEWVWALTQPNLGLNPSFDTS